MNDQEIKELVDKLDSAASKDNATVKINFLGHSDEGTIMYATKSGYLRLGIEFMKGAFAEKDNNDREDDSITIDLDYLISKDSDIHLDDFERNKNISQVNHNEITQDSIWGYLFLSLFIGFIIMAIIGATTTVSWIFQ